MSEMKKCHYCEREIPVEATFCWYCTRELVARPERPEALPSKSSRYWKYFILAAGGLLLLILVISTLLSG